MRATAAVRVVWRAAQVLRDHFAKDDEELQEALETLDGFAAADDPLAVLVLSGMDLRTVHSAVKQYRKKVEAQSKKSKFVPKEGHYDVNKLKLARFPAIEGEVMRALREIDRAKAEQTYEEVRDELSDFLGKEM